jgi:hypothetical protein
MRLLLCSSWRSMSGLARNVMIATITCLCAKPSLASCIQLRCSLRTRSPTVRGSGIVRVTNNFTVEREG